MLSDPSTAFAGAWLPGLQRAVVALGRQVGFRNSSPTDSDPRLEGLATAPWQVYLATRGRIVPVSFCFMLLRSAFNPQHLGRRRTFHRQRFRFDSRCQLLR